RLALARGEKPVVLILDEINRANLAAVLGEFVFAIDPGHRGSAVRLQYQGSGVSPSVCVPPNVWIIGTMNTADRSLALVDYAIRRRFRFLDVPADTDVVSSWYAEHVALGQIAASMMASCNIGLTDRLLVGHAAFLEPPLPLDTWPQRFARKISYQVLPLLAEYDREGLRAGGAVAFEGISLQTHERKQSMFKLAGVIQDKLGAA